MRWVCWDLAFGCHGDDILDSTVTIRMTHPILDSELAKIQYLIQKLPILDSEVAKCIATVLDSEVA